MNRAAAREMISAYVERPVAGVLAKMGVSPNMVTMAGLVGAGISAWLISEGMLWAGGIVMLIAGVLDLFDGSLARSTGQDSAFGALLDSVVDRVSEIVVLLGLLIFYARADSLGGTVLVYLAVGGSVMVSYLRARSEGLGIDCKVGIMTRPERVAALGFGLIVGHWVPVVMLIVLGVIAGLTILTTAQRLFHTGRSLNAGD
ncbi:MAG: CDP-alcohol phosphatidyltransferase family protein [Chloroflexi bacterium]|nr:CDP-alcohol phosphatidyltransferase family protein [Chloroflexota bacterium]